MNLDIDVDVDDIVWAMSSFEKKEMLSTLLDTMDIKDIQLCINNSGLSKNGTMSNNIIDNDDFDIVLMNLVGKKYKMTTEDETFIVNLSKKINP